MESGWTFLSDPSYSSNEFHFGWVYMNYCERVLEGNRISLWHSKALMPEALPSSWSRHWSLLSNTLLALVIFYHSGFIFGMTLWVCWLAKASDNTNQSHLSLHHIKEATLYHSIPHFFLSELSSQIVWYCLGTKRGI